MSDIRLYHNPRCTKSRGALELLKVLPFLDRLKTVENVRRIEKRFWSVPRRV